MNKDIKDSLCFNTARRDNTPIRFHTDCAKIICSHSLLYYVKFL